MGENEKFRILIVDDMATNRLVLKNILEPHGFPVIEAENGQNALQKASEEQPDIILMDIVMPDIDGITCLRQIRDAPEYKGAKLIMVTSESQYSRIKEAFDAGCSDYIVKPVQKNELLKKIDEISKFIRASRSLRRIRNNT